MPEPAARNHSPRRPRRPWRLAALVVVPLALLVAACGGGSDSSSGSGSSGSSSGPACPVDALSGAKGPVDITVWNNYTSLPKRTFEAMVAQYNQSQSKVRVSVQPQGVSFEEVLRKYKLAAEDKKLPNLALLEDTTTQVIADSGTIIPGANCYAADKASQKILDDFLPIAVASYTVDGKLQPVGFDVYTALIYYNRAHFTQAGLDPNTPPGTLDEMKAAAQKIKAARPDKTPVAVLGTSWQFEWWLTGVKQEIVNNDDGRKGLATAGTFANKQTDRLFDFWSGMVSSGLAKPFPGTEGQTDHLFSMATEDTSMVVESSAAVNTIAGLLEGSLTADQLKEDLGVSIPPGFKLNLDLSVGPFPGLDKPGQGQIGGGAWYLTNGGTKEQQAAAWDFMKWFNSTPQQVQWALAGSGLPVVQSAVDDPKLQQKWNTTLGGKWSKVAFGVLQNVDTGFPGPLIGDYKATREAIRNAYESVLLSGAKGPAAAAAANAKITAAAKEYKKTVGG
jgi:sn-glycerol 3-phosphate transport system substrate-binding protein